MTLSAMSLSTLIAALPILVLFGLLARLKVKPHRCATAGTLTGVVVATAFFTMPSVMVGLKSLKPCLL